MQSFNWQDFAALAPAVILVVAGCVLLLSEVFLRSGNRAYQPWLSAGFAVLAGLAAAAQLGDPARDLFGGFARLDGFGSFASMVVCFSLAVASLTAGGHLRELASERGEFHALAHLAAAGMVLLAVASDLLTLFVALEVMSLATYALTAWLRTTPRTSEAALKYFVLGSFSSAMFLYGAALAFGAAGSTRLADIAAAASASAGTAGAPRALLVAALVLMGSGFLFKVAAVPFHMWAPDVYEGAPTTVTGFMAAAVKTAAFAAAARVLFAAFGDDSFSGAAGGKGWVSAVGALAVVTMVVGNLMAIPQRSIKRMLAYSSISHAGYLLVGIASGGAVATRALATQATLIYLAAYAAAGLGAFAVVAALERRGGPDSDIDTRYDGLAQRHPVLALAMAFFILSLAGIPTTAGFVGKLLVFRAAFDAGLVWLVVVGVLTSVLGLYYYLRVLVCMYFRPAAAEAPASQPAPARAAMGLGLALAAAATLVFGIGPGPLTDMARLAVIAGQ